MTLGLILEKRKMTFRSWVSINNSVNAETFRVPCLAGRVHIAPLFLTREDPVHERSCRLHLQHLSKTDFCHHLRTTLIQALVRHSLLSPWYSSTQATWCEELTHWKRPWCWERSRAGGEGGDRGWHGWMASPTPWTWVWVDSGSWWWTARPGMLPFMGLQRVGHDWATELNYNIIMKSTGFLYQGTLNYYFLRILIVCFHCLCKTWSTKALTNFQDFSSF